MIWKKKQKDKVQNEFVNVNEKSKVHFHNSQTVLKQHFFLFKTAIEIADVVLDSKSTYYLTLSLSLWLLNENNLKKDITLL